MKKILAVGSFLLLATSAIAAEAPKSAAAPKDGFAKPAEEFFAAWNKHDVKTMATYWSDDATLINPRGRYAHGRADIQKLLLDEQTTVFKASTAKLLELKTTRTLGPNMVFCDGEMTVDGAVGPDGAAMPQMKIHLAAIMEKVGGKWLFADARPYAFPPQDQPKPR